MAIKFENDAENSKPGAKSKNQTTKSKRGGARPGAGRKPKADKAQPKAKAEEKPEAVEKPKHPGGRPSKKQHLDLTQVEKVARKGWTDEEMADFFGVDRRTWYRWKADDEEFCHALKQWKDEADERVERSLYERAMGYSHPDVHVSNFQGEITLTPLTKHYPPDTTAAIFWLKNRRPEQWRDKQEHAHTGNISVNITPDDAEL